MSQSDYVVKKISAYEYFNNHARKKLWPLWQYIVRQIEAKAECVVTRQEIMLSLGISRRTVANHLLELKELGLINKIHHGRNGIELIIVDLMDVKRATKGAIKGANPVSEVIKGANPIKATTVISNDLDVEEDSQQENYGEEYLEPILDNTDIDTKPIIDSKTYIDTEPIGPSKELTPAPSLPTTAEKFSKANPTFPLDIVGVHVSAIWYWAFKRYTLHNLDLLVLKETFGKMAAKFSKTIPKYIGATFEDMQKYIDWFLDSDDKFIRDQTQYGFEFMVSGSCINKYLADSGKKRPTAILNTEDKAKVRGKWQR